MKYRKVMMKLTWTTLRPLRRALPAVLILALSVLAVPLFADEPKETSPVFELRTYTTHPGKLDDLHKRFRDHTMALFKKHGMTNVIYWVPADRPNTLVYLLSHASEQAGRDSFTAFRNDPVWQKALAESHRNGELVAKVESVYVRPTDYSPVQTPAEFAKLLKGKPGLRYELRTYTTHEGKLDELDARFRDHTMALFKKHGMTNVLYTTPLDPKLAGNTLIYVIAHDDAAAAGQSWKAFGADPDWQKARAASEANGPLLIEGGVQRLYLTTTDYSPIK
jgi:hypothetical protein